MTLLHILALATVQGLGELLPVSSSAHVIVAEQLLGLDPSSPQMTFLLVMLHTGTMFAVIAYFWRAWRERFFSSRTTLRETVMGLQPSEDRIALDDRHATFEQVSQAIDEMGHVLAWAHLRGSGRQRSAIADDLVAFVDDVDAWSEPLMAQARAYASRVHKHWAVYCAAYDAGLLAPWPR